jgi:hypothetical protein
MLLATFISPIVVAPPNVGQMGSMGDLNPFGVPRYFGPYPNFATSPLPILTLDDLGNILSVSGGIRKFVDSLPGLGPDNADNHSQYLPVFWVAQCPMAQ